MAWGARLQTPNDRETAEVPPPQWGLGIEGVEIGLASRSARPQKPHDPAAQLAAAAVEDLYGHSVGEHPGPFGHR